MTVGQLDRNFTVLHFNVRAVYQLGREATIARPSHPARSNDRRPSACEATSDSDRFRPALCQVAGTVDGGRHDDVQTVHVAAVQMSMTRSQLRAETQ